MDQGYKTCSRTTLNLIGCGPVFTLLEASPKLSLVDVMTMAWIIFIYGKRGMALTMNRQVSILEIFPKIAFQKRMRS